MDTLLRTYFISFYSSLTKLGYKDQESIKHTWKPALDDLNLLFSNSRGSYKQGLYIFIHVFCSSPYLHTYERTIHLFIIYYSRIFLVYVAFILFITCLIFICICTCLAMFISFNVCINCRGRVVAKDVRLCDPTPLLYQIWQ